MTDFRRAVDEFVIADLGLAVEPAAHEVARSCLDAAGMLLLGEVHGAAQNPLLVRELVGLFDLQWVALEWPRDIDDTVRRFVEQGELGEHPQLGLGDGRITAGHLVVLRDLAATRPGFSWLSVDPMPWPAPEPGESSWSARDRVMAEILIDRCPGGAGLVIVGNAHTPLVQTSNGLPMGATLARARPGVRAITIRYGPGGYYNLGSRHFARRRGDGPPFLRLHQGELVLDLPRPTEATVLHCL